MSAQTQKHQTFFSTLVYISIVFRVYVIALIGVFLFERGIYSVMEIFFIVLISALLIGSDVFITLDRLYKKTDEHAHRITGNALKVFIIGLLFFYTIMIWMRISYWAYPAFGFFVAFLYMMDFVYLAIFKHLRNS